MTVGNHPYRITITAGAIVKIAAFLVGLYICYLIRDVLALLFVSLILAAAIDPLVDALARYHIPRTLTVLGVYVIVALVIAGTVVLLIPPIAEQFRAVAQDFPAYVDRVSASYQSVQAFTERHWLLQRLQQAAGGLESNVNRAAEGVLGTVSGIFGSIISFFIVLVVTFYMAVEENAVKKVVWSLAPPRDQAYVMQLVNRMQRQIGYWFRGQLVLMVLIGVFTWAGLRFLLPDYALVLGVVAGITEFIPYLGPVLGAVPAVFLAFSVDPFLALIVTLFYIVVQQVEGNILTPKIMQRAVGLNPIVSIAVLMAGLKLGGIVGGLLSIPVATAVSVVIKDWVKMRNRREMAKTDK